MFDSERDIYIVVFVCPPTHIWMECSYRPPDIWCERGGELRKPPERKLLLFLGFHFFLVFNIPSFLIIFSFQRSLLKFDWSCSLGDKRFSIKLSHVWTLTNMTNIAKPKPQSLFLDRISHNITGPWPAFTFSLPNSFKLILKSSPWI